MEIIRIINMKHIAGFCYCLALLMTITIVNGCTTQDFEYGDKVEDAYRIKIINTSEATLEHEQIIKFFYIDRRDSTKTSPEVIEPGETKLIAESEVGTYGVYMNIDFDPGFPNVRIILEKGLISNGQFTLDEVVQTINGNNTLFLREGQVR